MTISKYIYTCMNTYIHKMVYMASIIFLLDSIGLGVGRTQWGTGATAAAKSSEETGIQSSKGLLRKRWTCLGSLILRVGGKTAAQRGHRVPGTMHICNTRTQLLPPPQAIFQKECPSHFPTQRLQRRLLDAGELASELLGLHGKYWGS